jgi:hypothetical protein
MHLERRPARSSGRLAYGPRERNYCVMNLSGCGRLDRIRVRSQTELGTTMEYTQIAETRHDTFMRAVDEEMAKFERRETDFRKQDREERAAVLIVHADDYRLAHQG